MELCRDVLFFCYFSAHHIKGFGQLRVQRHPIGYRYPCWNMHLRILEHNIGLKKPKHKCSDVHEPQAICKCRFCSLLFFLKNHSGATKFLMPSHAAHNHNPMHTFKKYSVYSSDNNKILNNKPKGGKSFLQKHHTSVRRTLQILVSQLQPQVTQITDLSALCCDLPVR